MLKSTPGGAAGKASATPSFFVQCVIVPGLSKDSFQAIPVPGSGIPMRDYFAGQVITNLSGYDDDFENFDALARDAYRLADAMLKARETVFNDSQFHEENKLSDES